MLFTDMNTAHYHQYIVRFRCTIPATRNNRDRCTSLYPASVQFSGCAVRQYQGRCALIRKQYLLHFNFIGNNNAIQVNYLIDKAVNTGKGANNIISMLHHFLATHNFGEANLHLHADNCSGQNKNQEPPRHAVSCMASLDWPEQNHHPIIPYCGTY